MSDHLPVTGLGTSLATVGLLAVSSMLHAAMFVAYPGRYPARVVAVESPKVIAVQATVWPGYSRALHITLPGIAVPLDGPGAPRCQRELALRARGFVEDFLFHAQGVELRDIRMQDTALEEAEAAIFTERGSLQEAMKEAGLARPGDVDPQRPWC